MLAFHAARRWRFWQRRQTQSTERVLAVLAVIAAIAWATNPTKQQLRKLLAAMVGRGFGPVPGERQIARGGAERVAGSAKHDPLITIAQCRSLINDVIVFHMSLAALVPCRSVNCSPSYEVACR